MKKGCILLCLMMTSFILIDCSHSSRDSNTNIWPNFRGMNCSGIAASDQDPPITFGPDQNVLWKTTLPEGHSSPCIWRDYIFITGFQEEGKLLKMFCIKRNDGTIKWEKNISVTEFEEANPINNPAAATPCTDGERVYFYFSSFGIFCYDFTGKLIWKLPVPIPTSRHGMGTSPIVTSDLVILNCIGDFNDPRLLAINKYDGAPVWTYSLHRQDEYSGDSYATPVIYKDQVIVYTSQDVAGYNLKTGQQIWKYVIDIEDAVCTPALGKDIIYTVSYSTYGNEDFRAQFPGFLEFLTKYDVNKDLMIDKKEIMDFQFRMYPENPELSERIPIVDAFGVWDKNNDESIDSIEWKIVEEDLKSYYPRQGVKAIRLGGKGDISLNNLLWSNPDQVAHVSSPLYYNNHVYMIRDGGIFSCFNAESGKLLYRERLGATSAYFSSPIAANRRIYIASRNGVVTVIEAGDKLNILAQNDLGDIITATPAVVDNKLYIRTAKSLYAFGE